MAINNNLSVHYNGWLLPDIITLTHSYYHRGTDLNAMKRFVLYYYCISTYIVSIRQFVIHSILKKNQNTPRPSEHSPVKGKKYQNV